MLGKALLCYLAVAGSMRKGVGHVVEDFFFPGRQGVGHLGHGGRDAGRRAAWSACAGRNLARQRIEAEELVSEAFSHEIYGRGAERQQLLARAAELSPNQPGAHWHQGEVRVGNRWLPVTGPIENVRQRQLRETYEQRRSSAPDTIDGHLTLADWCAEHGLTAQESAHLDRIIQLSPDHLVARQRLGFQRVNGTWVRGQDLWQGLQQDQQTAESLRKWQRQVDELRRDSAAQLRRR